MKNINYDFKYAARHWTKKSRPHHWNSGPEPMQHDKYYAWLKHRAQANHRNEAHELTWDQWQGLWPDNLFVQRGRQRNSLSLSRVDYEGAWSIDNCEVIVRYEHLKRQKEYKSRTK